MHQKVDIDDAILTKKTILWLLLHHLVIVCYCFGGLLHLNVSGALEVMDICHFKSPKFNILFYFDSFKYTTRRSLELPTVNSLLSLVAMKTFVWLIGVFGFDWDREWHQHHGSWCMKSIAMRVATSFFTKNWLLKKLREMPITWKCSFFM
jgi:hypothetical protein